MQIIVSRDDVVKGVADLKVEFEKEEGVVCNIVDADYDKLLEDVQDEYDCGAKGEVIDILKDLNDSVGLDEYDILVVSE